MDTQQLEGVPQEGERPSEKEALGLKRDRGEETATPSVVSPVGKSGNTKITAYLTGAPKTQASPRRGKKKKKHRSLKGEKNSSQKNENPKIVEATAMENNEKSDRKHQGEPETEGKGEPHLKEGDEDNGSHKKMTKRTTKRQTHVIQAGPDGKAQVRSRSRNNDTSLPQQENGHKDEQYWKTWVQERERSTKIRVNFTLVLNDASGSLQEKKTRAISQLMEEARNFALLDSTTVFYPWLESSPLIAPPLTVDDITEDTTFHRYCKTVYINPNTPDKAKLDIHVGTVMTSHDWVKKIGDYLMGGQHGRVYMNTVNAPNSQNIGYAVMSTKLSNVQQMANRLSEASGLSIGIRSGPIVLGSERSTFWKGGIESSATQALQFYVDREDKDDAIEFLDSLLTGEYTKRQILLCPLMKFSLTPGQVKGKYEEDTQAMFRKKQRGFEQNIEVQEITGTIIASMDEKPEGHKYSVRQLIMRLRNTDPATSKYYPYLFYDVDKVGNSNTVRFIYFRFLQEQAILAAENILAILLRNFGYHQEIKDMFTHKAQEQADNYPWSLSQGGPVGKKSGRSDLPEGLMVMCKLDDESSEEELSSESAQENRPETMKLSEMREQNIFKGTHPRGGGSLASGSNLDYEDDSDVPSVKFGDEQELDEHQTLKPPARDDESLDNTTIATIHTKKAQKKKVAFALDDEFSTAHSIHTKKAPKTIQKNRTMKETLREIEKEHEELGKNFCNNTSAMRDEDTGNLSEAIKQQHTELLQLNELQQEVNITEDDSVVDREISEGTDTNYEEMADHQKNQQENPREDSSDETSSIGEDG